MLWTATRQVRAYSGTHYVAQVGLGVVLFLLLAALLAWISGRRRLGPTPDQLRWGASLRSGRLVWWQGHVYRSGEGWAFRRRLRVGRDRKIFPDFSVAGRPPAFSERLWVNGSCLVLPVASDNGPVNLAVLQEDVEALRGL